MLSFEDAAEYLDDIVDSLPAPLLRELNGGICIVPEVKHSNKANRLYTLGEYKKNRQMGRYIIIYYGSIKKAMSTANDDDFKSKLKEVLLHELTHHNESLAGNEDLELKDEMQIDYYKRTGVFLPVSKFDVRR